MTAPPRARRGAAAAPAPRLLLLAALLAAISSAPRSAEAQIFSNYKMGDSIGIDLICPFLSETTGLNLQRACDVVAEFADSLIDIPDDTCPTALIGETGVGSRQRHPISVGADGRPAPQALVTPAGGLPRAFVDGAKRPEWELGPLLKSEGATYNWLWQTIRNIKSFWPCSKPFGGNLDSILVPQGWSLVTAGAGAGGGGGNDTAQNTTKPAPAPDAPLPRGPAPGGSGIDNARRRLLDSSDGSIIGGVYTIEEAGGRRYPIMTIMKDDASSHMVVSVRGSNTRFEWARNFMYNRTSRHKFPGAEFRGNEFKGETHVGFTRGFDALWPFVQSALDSVVVAGGAAAVTITGHSQGAAISTLLSCATAAYLGSKGSKVKPSLVVFGSPLAADSAFNNALKSDVNVRRISFENDPFTILPCATKASAGKSSMPACAGVRVPTVDTESRGTPKPYWNDYQPTYGEIVITGDEMPVQTVQWQRTSNVLLKATTAVVQASHVCSYFCFLRQYSGPATLDPGNDNNYCLLKPEAPDSPILKDNGYCPGFDNPAQDWPRPTLDRDIFISSDDFPMERPPLWKFRTYADAVSWSCTRSKINMISIKVVHKPLPGITPDMMFWLYNNLGGDSEHPDHPGKRYPNMLLFHPRDHIKFVASRPDLSVGKKGPSDPMTTWEEFQATGCTQQAESTAAPWVCPSAPADNPGVMRDTPIAQWPVLSKDQVNSNVTVHSFTAKSGIKLWYHGCKKKGLCAFSTRTSHTWGVTGQDAQAIQSAGAPAGLPLVSVQEIGIGAGGQANNPRIVSLWSNGVDPMQKCARIALHFIEEYGALQYWLPQAYKAANAGR